MICPRCAYAADHGLPPAMHCRSQPGPGAPCCCQHQPPRRPPATTTPRRRARRTR